MPDFDFRPTGYNTKDDWTLSADGVQLGRVTAYGGLWHYDLTFAGLWGRFSAESCAEARQAMERAYCERGLRDLPPFLAS